MENISYFNHKMWKNLDIQENSKLLGEKTVVPFVFARKTRQRDKYP